MKVRGIRWLGSPTARFAEMRDFVRDVLRLELQSEDDDFAVFHADNGDTFEVFGPKAIANEHAFMVAPVPGFWVDDVPQARREMESKGVRFIGPVHRGTTSSWSHFYAPDGHIYELTDGE